MYRGAPRSHPRPKALGFRDRSVNTVEQRRRTKSVLTHYKAGIPQLNGTEIAEVLEFFRIQQGRLGSFDFEDPWTQMVIANCHFGQDVLTVRADGEFDNSTELLIVGPRI